MSVSSASTACAYRQVPPARTGKYRLRVPASAACLDGEPVVGNVKPPRTRISGVLLRHTDSELPTPETRGFTVRGGRWPPPRDDDRMRRLRRPASARAQQEHDSPCTSVRRPDENERRPGSGCRTAHCPSKAECAGATEQSWTTPSKDPR